MKQKRGIEMDHKNSRHLFRGRMRMLLALCLALLLAVSVSVVSFAERGYEAIELPDVSLSEEKQETPEEKQKTAKPTDETKASETSGETAEATTPEKSETKTKEPDGSPTEVLYTGIAHTSYKGQVAWWRIKDGVVQPKANGIFQNEQGWWYVKDGKVDFSHSGVDRNEYGWWRVENGKVDFKANGIYQNGLGWWRVKDGKVDFTANGIYQNKYGWWKTTNGQVTFKENGVFGNELGWWKVKNSKVDFGFNGIAKNDYGTWYLKNGKVRFDYTGLAQNSHGRWYIANGRVDFSYDGEVDYKGVTYTCTDGKVTGGTNAAEDNAVKVLNSVGWDFKKAYYWTINNITYNKTAVPVDGSYGLMNYANHGFEQRSGNCYTFSCCVYYLGYMANEDIHVVKGSVPYRSGGRGVHSWNEVDRDGKTYVLDAQYEQQWRNQGRQPYSGWLFTYGTKGSLVYKVDYQMD